MKKKIIFRNKIYHKLTEFLDEKILIIQSNMNQVQEDLASESKSSAGDKHETGRAMLHLEQEKNYTQLKLIQEQKKIMRSINPTILSKKTTIGSLLYIESTFYYLAVGIGEIKVDGNTIYCISPSSPVGKLIINKTEKEFPLRTPFGLFNWYL